MAVNEITTLNHGDALQIYYTNGIFNQINEAFEDMQLLKKFKTKSPLARQINWMIQTDLGIGAVGMRNVGTTARAFIAAQQSTSSEKTAYLRELQATVEIEEHLYDRAVKSREARYFEPLEQEMKNKRIGMMKRICASFYGSGLGVLGEISSVNVNSAVANRAVVTLQTADTDHGFVGFFELNDRVNHFAAAGTAGTAPTISAGTFDYWLVTDKDRDDNTVTLAPVNTLGNTVNVSAWSPAAGEALYLDSQSTIPNTGSVTDYGTETDCAVGLESWSSEDGRTVFGVTMSGATKGTVYDCSANPIDARHLQRGLSRVKTVAGEGLYKYEDIIMAPETEDALIESREADRYFSTVSDPARGMVGRFVYRHRNDALKVTSSEYVPAKRIYSVPKGVLQFHGTDAAALKTPGGDTFHLKPASGGGHVDMLIAYMRAHYQIVCVKPSAVLRIGNFTNS